MRLAVLAFHKLVTINQEAAKNVKLVLAGGYDQRLQENVQHYQELEDLVKQRGLQNSVMLLKNITDEERKALLSGSLAVLYTPSNEHFGIVPVESMMMKKVVLACNNGGPKESIIDGQTGFLLPENDEVKWAD